MNIIHRPIIDRLEEERDTKQIIVLTGMRRVGKTTVLRYLFDRVESSNKVFLDLENPLNRKLFEEENYDAVWQNLLPYGVNNKNKSYIFLDEIQNLPGISSTVKYLYDHYNVKFYLTGSSSFYLKNLFSESLAGRKTVFEIFPLTFREFINFKGVEAPVLDKNKISYELLIPYYREYMEFGGFPGVVLEENFARKKSNLEDIFQSYFEKDVKNLSDFREIAKVRDLILLLASRVGQKLDVSKLATELELSRITVDNYLNFLEQTYFVTLLPRYSKSIDVATTGRRKVYFCDCGMTNFLGKVDEGSLFEQSIFQNLRVDNNLAYFDRDSQMEIDFIANGVTAYEVKISPTNRDARDLEIRGGEAGIKNKFLVSLNYSVIRNALPATSFLPGQPEQRTL
ncbi:MAG: ATP-binding protein [bacterium]|nr:ATP-binding protein [bacterium]